MKCGAFSGFAVDGDRSIMLLNDAVGDGESQAGSFSHGFGSEKWVK